LLKWKNSTKELPKEESRTKIIPQSILFHQFTIFDYLLVVYFFAAFVHGFAWGWRGSLVLLFSLIGFSYFALFFSKKLGVYWHNYVGFGSAFSFTFLVVLILGYVFAGLLNFFLKSISTEVPYFFNKLGGGLVGIVVGFLFLADLHFLTQNLEWEFLKNSFLLIHLSKIFSVMGF